MPVYEVRARTAKPRGSWGFFGPVRPISLIRNEDVGGARGLQTASFGETGR